MRLIDLRDRIKAGARIYRRAWPSYAAWQHKPEDGTRYYGRADAEYFWREVMQEPVQSGIPAGLYPEDLRADDWEVL